LTYIEPSTYYTESVVVAEVDNAIQTYGERAVDLVAFGCTDSDQATRYATWILNSELENTIVVSYTGGADHFRLIPGDIVEYYDSGERGVRRSGRIVSQTGANVVLDAPIQAVIGDFFSLTLGDGTVHQSTITAISGVNVTMAAAPLSNAIPWAVFIASPAIGRKLYKVIKVDETSIGRYATTLQLYKIDKY
jgi:predicted phage tail protein